MPVSCPGIGVYYSLLLCKYFHNIAFFFHTHTHTHMYTRQMYGVVLDRSTKYIRTAGRLRWEPFYMRVCRLYRPRCIRARHGTITHRRDGRVHHGRVVCESLCIIIITVRPLCDRIRRVGSGGGSRGHCRRLLSRFSRKNARNRRCPRTNTQCFTFTTIHDV